MQEEKKRPSRGTASDVGGDISDRIERIVWDLRPLGLGPFLTLSLEISES